VERRAVLGGAALALAVLGCGRAGSDGSTRFCTLAGCAPPVVVEVDQPGERPLEACVGEVCSGGVVAMIHDVALGDTVEVVVRVAGGGAEVARATARPVTSHPNGAECEPECRGIRLRLTVDDQLVPA
jgi:hypothetical protein